MDEDGHLDGVDADALADAVALAGGAAFVVLHGYARTAVTGADATAWLHDLLTADVATLAMGGAVRSFVLTPTGRIRTEVRVIRRQEHVELVEASDEPRPIAEILAPYVLSADVELAAPSPVAVVAVPGGDVPGRIEASVTPSIVGAGTDVVEPVDEGDSIVRTLSAARMREVPPAAAEVLRIWRGIPRWRVDVPPESFPVGARVDDAIAFAKGCFLGQEAIARIRNLGHPPTVLRHLATEVAGVRVGDVVRSEKGRGDVMSAAPPPTGDGTVLLARVDHRASGTLLVLEDGTPLTDLVRPPLPA